MLWLLFTYFSSITLALVLLAWAFHWLTKPERPSLILNSDATYWHRVLNNCQILTKKYRPPVIWGRSGHIQSLVYALYGRLNPPLPSGERQSVVISDGATVTFDVFEVNNEKTLKQDVTIIVCGGIGNGTHSAYIRTFTLYAQSNGYRVVVLNHLGANYSIPLTSPRLFCFGSTEELASVVEYTEKTYPLSNRILVGFSMGGNIALKYLGEEPTRQSKFLCAMSVCQGYCAMKGYDSLLNTWRHWRRLYLMFMARGLKRTLNHHRDVLFTEKAYSIYGKLDVKAIFEAKTLVDIDKEFFSKMCGFKKVEDYYRWCSSVNYIDKIKGLPVLLLNAKDDPIIPGVIQQIGKDFAKSHSNIAFVGTRHGGHLGYFENGWFWPNEISWLDRFVVEVSNSVISE